MKRISCFYVSLSILVLGTNFGMVTAQISETKLTASDGGRAFGICISISGDYAIVGEEGSWAGYVFKRSGTSWVEQTKLIATPAHGITSDWVSIDGNFAIVGANESAYIFRRDNSGWTQQAKLIASDVSDNSFGVSVSISGDYVIIGAFADDDNGPFTGSAYIFKRNAASWIEQAKIKASDGATFDQFGLAVSINGDYAIVGAQGDINGDRGAAYIFKRDDTNWTQQAALTASDFAPGDLFGSSVSISGDNAIVGAPFNSSNGFFFRLSLYL